MKIRFAVYFEMNSLSPLLVINLLTMSVAINVTDYFIDSYVNPSVRHLCAEKQEQISFQFGFRARKQKNVNSHIVYLFSEDRVFRLYQMTAALNFQNTSFALNEIFFTDVQLIKDTDFWNGLKPNETFNAIFTDYGKNTTYAFNAAAVLFGDTYRLINLSLDDNKVIRVNESVNFSNGMWGFMKNDEIKRRGFENIFSVDIAHSIGTYSPIRVYVKDVSRDGVVISYAFPNRDQLPEEWLGGKHFNYHFDSTAYLSFGRSMNNYSHYFELRTRKGTFSLFDFTYNKDFLLVGANEELMGCPPSVCHWREFDDIIRLHSGTKLLVYREWFWKFNKTREKPVYEEATILNVTSRQHGLKNFAKPFKFGIRTVVDGSFIDDSNLYIFRNGSFISSETDDIINNSTEFRDFTRIDEFFTGVPFQAYDAILYHKDSRTVHFFKETMEGDNEKTSTGRYWSFSMSNMLLITDPNGHLVGDMGLPSSFRIKSVYVEENESGKQIQFYLFTKNRYIVFNELDFDGQRFKSKTHSYYCTSVNFFGCPENLYSCPPLPGDETNAMIMLYIIILIIIIIALFAIILLLLCMLNRRAKKGKSSDANLAEQMGATSMASGVDSKRSNLKADRAETKLKTSQKGQPIASFADLPTTRSKTSVVR